MIADKIKDLRKTHHMTQNALAKKLNITRASVNAWEQGISVPSTQYLIELASIFKVSTDYLLSVKSNQAIDISGLSSQQVALITELVSELKK
ncbi:MAG: helix-turn-helix transcriptional regulator [Spirochaetia bacterium]|nr:helix-turn-helix transcriptional regulator [Spirochaetia bacterium]MBR0318020.1 helix-turn-helix transcriptional regulator [Spirochaetia bacterium]